MSNLLKKSFLGVSIATFVLFGALSIKSEKVSASVDCTITQTLKVGSKNVDVVCLQEKIGGLVADGVFGLKTKSAVVAYQAANGLVADGVVGPLTRATFVSSTSTNDGCPAGALFNTNTGVSCSVVVSYPAGCSSVVGYSSTTGVKCDSSTVTPVVLNGGAGDINVASTSTDLETVVTEGASNVNVLGFKVEALDSDVTVTNLKVSLANVGTGSTRLNRYLGLVSVYMNGIKVGSADVSDFSENGAVYSKSITLNNAIVKEGLNKKETFYVTVSANDSIDSVNMTSADFAVLVNNIRFQDATGVVMTSSSSVGSISAGKFTFSSLANSGNVKVTVSEGLDNPLIQSIAVLDTSSTKNVLMLEVKIKTVGSDISFDSFSVTPTSTLSSITSIVGELQLKDGSSTLATLDGSSLVSGSSKEFSLDGTYTIPADTTKTLSVYATINDWDNFKVNGGTLKVDFASFSPEDNNGDVVVDTGSASGAVQSFLLNGAQVTYVSDSYTPETTGTNPANGTIGLNFTVKAFGSNDITIAETQTAGWTIAATHVVNATSGATAVGNGIITSTDITKNGSNNFVVTAGNTGHFTLSRKFNTATGFVRLEITSVDGTVVTNIITGAH